MVSMPAAGRVVAEGAVASEEARPAEVSVPTDEELAQKLVERAPSEGVELVGRGGLLTDLRSQRVGR